MTLSVHLPCLAIGCGQPVTLTLGKKKEPFCSCYNRDRVVQNISRKWRRSINADTADPALILVEKPASSNVTASRLVIIQQLGTQLEGRKRCSNCLFINGRCWA